MMNVGSRAPACPPFNIALRERGPTAIQDKRPRSGHGLDWFSNPGDLSKRKRDHIPNRRQPARMAPRIIMRWPQSCAR
jgi:hypothetical protein